MDRKFTEKVVTASEAVEQFVSSGSIVGIGGQTIGRCSMALAHEIVRQNKQNLILVGCSMSISMDLMVGAGLVSRTECGTGNVESFGATMRWRRAVEEGKLEVRDFSHLSMAFRFLAGSLGLPFMPTKSMLGTDLISESGVNSDSYIVMDNPWQNDDPVVLLKALNPDVSIIHAQKADKYGNVVIEGFKTHEIEMAKASTHVLVTCEEIIDSDEIRSDPSLTTIPYIYVDAVILQKWGGYPTSVYHHYVHDADHISLYQKVARVGGIEYQKYLDDYVYGCKNFDEYLSKVLDSSSKNSLIQEMDSLLE